MPPRQLRQECLWERVLPPAPPASRLGASLRTQVCVIGGGITGLCAAIRLLERGYQVVLLDAHRVGHGGSGRNVGLVNAGTWIRPDDVQATLGNAVGERLNRVLGEAPARVFEIIARHGIDCQAHNEGTLHMAHNAHGEADLQARHDQWRRRGANIELLTGARCREYCGTDKVSLALLDHRAGTINPMAYTRGLAAAVERLGGALYQDTPVTGLQREGDAWRVTTADGSVEADKVVIATGAYTEGDWNSVKNDYFRGYYLQVASVPLGGPAAEAILPRARGSWDTRTVLSSIRRDDDGRLLLGSMGRLDNKPAWFVRSWADRIQRHYFPELGTVEWECHWTGAIDFTPDHLMRLYEPAPGLIAVTGYNGRGNTTGTVLGAAMADFVIDDCVADLPMPFSRSRPVSVPGLRTGLYEAGFSLYHAGQCLRVVL
ncbi:FAD-binding oxidoreductase [Pseudomonas sp. RIT-PI-S]|uniref:L-pipecolate oxidase n=1 Tax=Pseudomonas sp. RIT-PI-S TaxID=3035295 RepID=UPI0021D9CD91|nr:FAD-binding oxidoreductase [Pseudomonas sp. RIT-PI-S]